MSVQEMGGSITSMLWRAPLIRLTQPGNPCRGEEDSPTFLDPSAILWVRRNYSKWKNEAEETQPTRFLYTEIYATHFVATVLESPEEIARLRDAAFGHAQPALRSV